MGKRENVLRVLPKGETMEIDNTFGLKYFPAIPTGGASETTGPGGMEAPARGADAEGEGPSPYLPDIPPLRSIQALPASGEFGVRKGFMNRLISVKA